MTAYLRRLGYEVNATRGRRLWRTMGREAVYQKPATSTPNPEPQIPPYRLRGLVINRCDQGWRTEPIFGWPPVLSIGWP